MHETDLMEIDINLVASCLITIAKLLYLDKIVLKYFGTIQKKRENNREITRFHLRIGQTHKALGFHKVTHNFIEKHLFCNRF